MVSSNLHSSRLENRCWEVVLNANDRLARSLARAILSLARLHSCANERADLSPRVECKTGAAAHVFPRRVYASGHERVRSRFPASKARERMSGAPARAFLPAAFIDMDDTT